MIDSKAKKLNQRFKKAAMKQVQADVNEGIIRIAGLIPSANFSQESNLTPKEAGSLGAKDIIASNVSILDGEELKEPGEEPTKKSVEKIVQDFRLSLMKALDQLGEYSNAEKHINELVHRANFRFSDLQTCIQQCRRELTKCQKLRDIIQDDLNEEMEKIDQLSEED